MSDTQIIGIDLGTTNSVLAILDKGTPHIVPIQGARLLPSVVGIDSQGAVLVGETAWNQWLVSPERTVRSIKRKMGATEPVVMAGKSYTPQEISAFILRTVRSAAQASLGEVPERAVITVPAYFSEVQRQATLEAGEIAGLSVERIINEPTAAALAYGYGVGISDDHLRVLVYDLGGGTFDVSVIELNYGVVDVVATAGDNRLGGDDLDETLASHLAAEFRDKHKVDLLSDHRAWARLLRAAEEAKIALSSEPFVTVSLEYIATDRKGRALHLQSEVERDRFEDLIEPYLARTLECIDRAMADAKMQAGDVDRVLLVGGSTRIPAVWNLVSERMEQDPHMEIDPDAAVALGAAVQAGIIAGDEIDAVLVDVTPYSLGIESVSFGVAGRLQTDVFAQLIRRNSTVPVRKSEAFTTLFPGQDTIHVKVFQGESYVASENVLLGDFRVENLQAREEGGLAEVTIDFQLDVNGILDVTVTDRGSGQQVRERLKADRQRLSPDQIAQSQAKLAELVGDVADTLELDPGLLALIHRADRVLGNEDLDAQLRKDIRTVMEEIRQATHYGDAAKVEELSDELIDLLFEAEE